MLERLRAFWREIEPGLSIDRENEVSRWDDEGSGRGWCFDFEGLGVSCTIFIGRTPKRDPERSARRERALMDAARAMAGEGNGS